MNRLPDADADASRSKDATPDANLKKIMAKNAGTADVTMEPALSAGMDHAVEKDGDKAKGAVEKMAATVFIAALLRTGDWHYVKGTSMKEPPTS